MSDAPQGPGWWQASDMKWYPPEAAPGAQPPAAPQGQPSLGQPATAKPAVALKPQQIILMATGGVTFLASFFAIASYGSGSFKVSANAWDKGFRSFTFEVLLALAVSVVVALKTFGVVEIPKKLVSFTLNQLAAVVGLFGVLLSFSVLISLDGASMGFGLILIFLASIGSIVGAFLGMKEDGEI